MSDSGRKIGETVGSSLRRVGQAFGAWIAGSPDPADLAFVETLFLLFGHVARSGGMVTPRHVELGERLIERMQLGRRDRRIAVAQFERGKAGGFDLGAQLQQFQASQARHGGSRARKLLDVLIELAGAEGTMPPAARALLERIGAGLGFAGADLRRRLDDGTPLPPLLPAQAAAGAESAARLEQAYGVLGLEAASADEEVRRSYRRLLSRLHPDKLAGQGLRGDALKGAQDKTRELREAYEVVCAARGMK